MFKTEVVKRMALAMFSGPETPQTKVKARHVIRQLKSMPENAGADFEEIQKYLYELVDNHQNGEALKKKNPRQ